MKERETVNSIPSKFWSLPQVVLHADLNVYTESLRVSRFVTKCFWCASSDHVQDLFQLALRLSL